MVCPSQSGNINAGWIYHPRKGNRGHGSGLTEGAMTDLEGSGQGHSPHAGISKGHLSLWAVRATASRAALWSRLRRPLTQHKNRRAHHLNRWGFLLEPRPSAQSSGRPPQADPDCIAQLPGTTPPSSLQQWTPLPPCNTPQRGCPRRLSSPDRYSARAWQRGRPSGASTGFFRASATCSDARWVEAWVGWRAPAWVSPGRCESCMGPAGEALNAIMQSHPARRLLPA
jgi:hypothetical protein